MSPRQIKTKPVIGIVGGIGAGKTTAAAEFVALGCRLIDADAIGHELLKDPSVLAEIRDRWPGAVAGPRGPVDRKTLGERVFADPAELDALNRILHPRIRRRMARRIGRALKEPDLAGVIVDAAVLFEAGWDDLCTHRVFVSAPGSRRLGRVARQRRWSRRDWEQREKSQISLDMKEVKCDYTIDNRSSVSRLREHIRELFHRICSDFN